jgi:hypothetical protein
MEPITMKSLRAFWACVYLLKAFRCAVMAIRHEQIGSQVIWDGRECFISNWANSQYMTISGDRFYKEFVPREEIKNVINARELWHRFEFGLSFYLSNWYGIDVNKRIYK